MDGTCEMIMEPKKKSHHRVERAGREIALAYAAIRNAPRQQFSKEFPKGEHGKIAKMTDAQIDARLEGD